ncbi:MAG: PA14 domain-containing protein [Ferruginibacter sp.]
MMIVTFSKYQKPIAFSLFFLFYLETLMAGYAFSKYPEVKEYAGSSSKTISSVKNITALPEAKSQLADTATVLASENIHAADDLVAVSGGGLNFDGPGPSQPEMQSFKSVNTDNLVDLFTGDFSYNIPLLDVGGYPIGIHYNSGITMDAEASWVGLGWNINPGAINRNVRGLPDDFSAGDSIVKEQNIKPNRTIGGTLNKSFELFGKKFGDVGVKAGVFHNSYKGWGVEYGITPGTSIHLFSGGELNAGLSISNNNQTGLDVSPSFSVGLKTKLLEGVGLDYKVGSNYNSRTGIAGLQMGLSGKFMKEGVYVDQKDGELSGSGGGNTGSFPVGSISFEKPSFTPGISMPFTTESYTFSLSPGTYKRFNFKSYGTISGYTSVNSIEPADRVQKMPAFGYLNLQKAKSSGDKVLLDFNRDKEVAFTSTTPHIAVPYYTYDLFSIAGEGIGGSFRPYRSDIGYVFDHNNRSKSKSGSFSLEAGWGQWAQVGFDVDRTNNTTSAGPWKTGNNLAASQIEFRDEDSSFAEPVYFKNPGEFTASDNSFYNALGDTNLVNLELVGVSGPNTSDPVLNNRLVKYKNQVKDGVVPVNLDSYRKSREKRTQVISYLNAGLASKYALDTLIKVYDLNAIPSLGCNSNYQTIKRLDDKRKENHLSEITVLNKEGKRYVYGIPTYNIVQEEVAFAVNKDNADLATGLVGYVPGVSNSVNNNTDKTDQFFNKEVTPAYAQSFMLSSILSADYVDVTGNGISEDDQGDAIKFNYSRVYGGSNNYYRWRAPYYLNKASYGEGLKSDRRDDRGSYTYGEKEVWYLNSVESKNMIAVFKLETDVDKVRKDMYGVSGRNGGADYNQKMYYLKEINLYAKADLIKNGNNGAKPVKTVHFEYDYSLCKNHPGAINAETGKLTLRKIWFTYNRNDKGVKNPYLFRYDKDIVDVNGNLTGNNSPGYNNKSYDRWGNYKETDNNPGTTGDKLSNLDFPYATQNTTEANTNAAAWSLNEIMLPSGGRMKITYESDDYGYVQNRRAAQMMVVAGFGKEATDAPGNFLYNHSAATMQITSNYIFVKVPEEVTSKQMILDKYLSGIEKLFVKFNMKVKTDVWGGGSEMVSCYMEIDDFGVKGAPSEKMIWIKPKLVGGKNPFLLAATQFLRMNLYSKAYPYSEPGDNMTVRSFLLALGSVFSNIKNATAGFYNYTIAEGRCKEIISSKSFVRLNSPSYKKLGGGHRVKKVELFDNWKKMTDGAQGQSVYGKEYEYSTKIQDAGGKEILISSGVASYEPMIGKEENPFTIPSDPYKQQVGLLGPTNYFYVDEPLMESFYPSAMVGYSKVRVRSINKLKKSSSGFQETEFFTTKDFPTRSSYTPLVEGVNKYSFQNPKSSALSFFNFNVKSYVTISQGFKVELNDMNGKVKSTASYAENDSVRPVSYSRNYFRLENDNLASRLSTKVDVIRGANGIVDKEVDMGKDIEMMVDLREQLSVTRNSNKQKNLLVQRIAAIPYFFPIFIPLTYQKSEINRYRSAAVTKVVNIHGIMDSMVVVEKGSKVSTKNIVFDAETGDVLLSRTNNEFDDPVYNFNYPAHWAYREMGGAYKNIQKLLKDQKITDGVLYDRSRENMFESGDEIILTEKEPVKNTLGSVVTLTYRTISRKIWAISAAKGAENHQGIYFIDANGKPVTTVDNLYSTLLIIRSGKRNLMSASVGAVTSLENPLRPFLSKYKVAFDSNSRVVNVSAMKFKETWRIDSTVTPKDTCYKKIDSATTYLYLQDALTVKQKVYGTDHKDLSPVYKPANISAMMQHVQVSGNKGRTNSLQTKTSFKFDLSTLPEGAIVTNAYLSMAAIPLRDTTTGMTTPKTWIYNNGNGPAATDNEKAHYDNGVHVSNDLGNKVIFSRVLSNWTSQSRYNDLIAVPAADLSSVSSSFTTGDASCQDLSFFNITNLIQALSDNRNTSFGAVMAMNSYSVNPGPTRQTERRSRSYFSGFDYSLLNYDCVGIKSGGPFVQVNYKYFKDTCHLSCTPSVRPDGTNPYKFGILGNWRMYRAYTYYNDRKETDATTATNIRQDGTIKTFMPFWDFASTYLDNSNADTIDRWVWNNEMTMVNRKGAELENRDPLERYNSVQYGYNKNLPIAVAQNSKARNMVFDGFEDYDYKTSYCETECTSYNCLPPVYDTRMNNCDTLRKVADSFIKVFNVPSPVITRDSAGCDISTWGYGQSNIGSGKTYPVSAVYFDGMLGIPDSGTVNQNLTIQYKRNICNPTNAATYEIKFKLFNTPIAPPSSLIFLTYWGSYLHDVRIGQSPTNGSSTPTGLSTITRTDLKYDFRDKYNILKIHYGADDSLAIYVNDTLLGKVGSYYPGNTLIKTIPALQFNRCNAKVDWITFKDANGKLMLDEQFNNCSDHALPKPDYNCQTIPDCAMAFTNFFNNYFKSSFTLPQIGTLYRNCSIYTTPCGDSIPTCQNYDTVVTRTAGFDRFADFTKGGGVRVSTQKHTGKFSLSVAPNKTAANIFPVVTAAQDQVSSSISIKVDTVIQSGVYAVTPRGAGLLTRYNVYYAKKNLFPALAINACMNRNIDPSSPLYNANTEYSPINKDWGNGSPQQFSSLQYCAADYFGVEWTGNLQPQLNSKYVFRLLKGNNDEASMYINGTPVLFRLVNGEWLTDSVSLQSCVLYDFRLKYTHKTGSAKCILLWSNPQSPEPAAVPVANFYKPGLSSSDTTGTCVSVKNSVKLNTVKAQNIYNPYFSPIAGTKIVVSAWVKESIPCNTGSYTKSGIDVNFGNSSEFFKLRPAGNIIEGWQRIEGVLTIPSGATSVNIGLRALDDATVYFDDIRVSPFNATLKSFVYNPWNLRLMAELDENNYASFYEYDDDGTLIRVKKETINGIKTIQETRSALIQEQL